MEEHRIEITMVSVTINLVLGVKGTGHNEHLSEIYFEITDETTLLQTYKIIALHCKTFFQGRLVLILKMNCLHVL